LNNYTYVRNNPVVLIDPDGRDPITPNPDILQPLNGELVLFSVTVWAPMELYGTINNIPQAPWQAYMGGRNTIRVWDDEHPRITQINPGYITVHNPSKTGPQENRISQVMSWISANIDKGCTQWLSGVSDAIDSLLGNPSDEATVLIGHGQFNPLIAAFTGNNSKQTNLPAGYAITVNNAGAFFNSQYKVGGLAGGSGRAQVHILLHELAHFLNAAGFQDDFNNSRAGISNDRLVKKHCGKMVRDAKNIP
jgi:hypothetical protein